MADRQSGLGRSTADLQRITTISDSVFSVALTLLVAGARLPAGLVEKSLSFADLGTLAHDIGAIVMSFCVASIFWLGHGVYLRKAIRTTVPFLISNLFVLLCIVLLPVSTRVLSSGPLGTASAALYSANLLAMACAQLAFRHLATRLSVPEGASPSEPRVPRHSAPFAGIALHGTALGVAFIQPAATVTIWGLALLIPLIEAWTHRMNATNETCVELR